LVDSVFLVGVSALGASLAGVGRIDTVCVPYCQDRHRSSYGCAASGRKVTGFDSALTRRFEPGLPRFPARMSAIKEYIEQQKHPP
jgi:hypothetical protein